MTQTSASAVCVGLVFQSFDRKIPPVNKICFYTAKYARLMHAFFPGMVCAFTLPEVNCRLELAPQ